MLLTDFLRHELGLTGTHVGCEHGVCGACTIQIDGVPARSCLTLAVQADGAEIRTVEALAPEPGRLSMLQEASGGITRCNAASAPPGILMSLDAYLRKQPDPSEDELREFLSGHLCRCTGYVAHPRGRRSMPPSDYGRHLPMLDLGTSFRRQRRTRARRAGYSSTAACA